MISTSVLAETVYKKTNPDGSVTFTDKQSTDSEEVEVREPTSFAPPRLPAIKPKLPVKKLKPKFNYTLYISQPENDSTIVGKHDVAVSIGLSPNLSATHKIRYQIGNRSIVSRNTGVTFKNVDRGTHNLQVTIVDSNGDAVSPVATRVFHMKRFFKKRPPPPAAKPKAP